MAEKKVVRHIEPFTNEFGDFIKPGDMVYAVTVSTKHTAVSKGEYLGVIKREDWRGNVEKYVQVLVDTKQTAWRWKDTKEDTTWNEYYKQLHEVGREVEPYQVPCTRISTLQLNRIMPISISTDRLAAAI